MIVFQKLVSIGHCPIGNREYLVKFVLPQIIAHLELLLYNFIVQYNFNWNVTIILLNSQTYEFTLKVVNVS